MKNNKIKYIALSLILLIAVAGCTPTNTNMRNLGTQTRLNDNRWFNTRDRLNTNLNTGMDTDLNLNNEMVRFDTNNPNTNNITNGQLSSMSNRANIIAQRVEALPEVNRATVLINGNRAIVGVDVRGDLTNTIDANLRNRIEAAVKAADRNIRTVSITSDPTLMTRIRNLSTQINNGNIISNFADEFEDLLRRITSPITNTVR
ncbi:MAG TPA: YhcN/YlaJ family sporulation lipoprotein [Tissierellaceae bacterium]